ncbi:MAG: glutamyl-tRNA amidotransferase [Flavobacteriales bacterium]|nr:glutamyl-tRNA amidotransferase [Crocinitomicaceae bacterium]MBO74108.1 glutamyl-tRNA amidotransferase [Flavobacteriales bacterium]
MSMYSTISHGIKDAMRNKDRERLAALRDVKSKLMLEATKTGADGDDIPDSTVLAILTKLFKQRSETAELYAEQGRADLEAEERAQASVIAEFLPQPLTEEQIKSEVEAILAETGATGMGEMGKVMGIASSRMAGKADGKVIAGIVRSALNS